MWFPETKTRSGNKRKKFRKFEGLHEIPDQFQELHVIPKQYRNYTQSLNFRKYVKSLITLNSCNIYMWHRTRHNQYHVYIVYRASILKCEVFVPFSLFLSQFMVSVTIQLSQNSLPTCHTSTSFSNCCRSKSISTMSYWKIQITT